MVALRACCLVDGKESWWARVQAEPLGETKVVWRAEHLGETKVVMSVDSLGLDLVAQKDAWMVASMADDWDVMSADAKVDLTAALMVDLLDLVPMYTSHNRNCHQQHRMIHLTWKWNTVQHQCWLTASSLHLHLECDKFCQNLCT